jgi:mono/diheme cytochrome c family protein
MRNFFFGLIIGLTALPVAALVMGSLGRLQVQATAEPPRWEKAFAQRAFDASVARHAERLQNPIAPTEENLLAGLIMFRNNCSGCHGDSDQRSVWGTAGFYPRVPQFGFEHPTKPDWQMFWIVKHGVRNSGMGAWKDLVGEEKIWQVVTFLSKLDSLPPTVAARWQKQSPPEQQQKKK